MSKKAESSPPKALILNGGEDFVGKSRPAVELSRALQKTMLRLKGECMDEDGKKIHYDQLTAFPVFSEYKKLALELQKTSLEGMSEDERKVFFINVYNALTIHGLADMTEKGGEIPSSVLDIQQFWMRVSYKIAGMVYSLDDIEHGILRANRPHPSSTTPPFGKDDPRLKFSLSKLDPRVHFALVCGAKSCPAINVYSASNLDAALTAATKNFCRQEVMMILETEEIWLSKIFQWYSSDFGFTDIDVIRWTIPYLDEDQQEKGELLLYKLESLGKVDIKYNPYDWSLNKS
ncbi:uncharacterized protein LOC135467371 [Liolophura sinensis]|uniref:uncharacterized protein LOC135467371 n=1 Tax=Liolophura sinensis TaxID=3198878 RepID=UPI0031586572